jgi:hypothetical protein
VLRAVRVARSPVADALLELEPLSETLPHQER